jgi:hypothetical protein
VPAYFARSIYIRSLGEAPFLTWICFLARWARLPTALKSSWCCHLAIEKAYTLPHASHTLVRKMTARPLALGAEPPEVLKSAGATPHMMVPSVCGAAAASRFANRVQCSMLFLGIITRRLPLETSLERHHLARAWISPRHVALRDRYDSRASRPRGIFSFFFCFISFFSFFVIWRLFQWDT